MADAPRRRRLSCQGSDYLFDLDERRVVTTGELIEHVRRGGRFEAVDADSGDDRTLLVLARMLGDAMPAPRTPPAGSLLPDLTSAGRIVDLLAGLKSRRRDARNDEADG